MTEILQSIRRHLHLLVLVAIGLGLANVHFLGGWALPRMVLILVVVVLVLFPVMINMDLAAGLQDHTDRSVSAAERLRPLPLAVYRA